MKYKKVETKNGRTMYFVNGEMVKQELIPTDVLQKLQPGVELDVIMPIDPNKCVVCDEPSTHKKFLNEKTIGVCDEHYQTTSGKLAQAMREKS